MPIPKPRSLVILLGLAAACSLLVGCGEIAPSGDGAFTLVATRNSIGSYEYVPYDNLSGLAVAPTSGTVYAICWQGGARRVVPYAAADLAADTPLDLAAIDADLKPYEIWVEGSELHVLCGGSFNGEDWNDLVFDAETGLYANKSYEASFLVDTFQSFTAMRVVGAAGGVYFVDPFYKRVGFSVRDGVRYNEPTTLVIDEARIKSYLPRRDRELEPVLGDIAWDGDDRLAISVCYVGDCPEGGCVLVLDAASLDLVQYIGGDWLLEGACGLDYDDSGRLVVADRWGESLRVFQGSGLLDWSSEDGASGGVEQGVLNEPTRLRVLGSFILVLDDDGDGDGTSSLLKYTYAP